jgi:tRNA G18 (ribose-2'-O)-methylase SpoU
MSRPINSRNDRFQQWQALLTNRNKRQRSGEMLVQGVRPITLAVQHRWTVRTLLHDPTRVPSRWAEDLLASTRAEVVAMERELLHELGGKTDDVPELLAVVATPNDDLRRIPVSDNFLGVVFDRPSSPGNIGTLVRSADALGASGVIVSGHSADVYDPKTVRASTGSLFALPVVRAPGHREVLAWIAAAALPVAIVGLDEKGSVDISAHDLRAPTLLLVGNEHSGLSAAWREACHRLIGIPIGGAASSLNASVSASIALYEARRQRREAPR